MSQRLSARERIALLTDTFEERDAKLRGGDPLSFDGYSEQLARSRAETGLDEACLWGFATIDDIRCALVVFDFAFLGGSMGLAVGEKVARAFDAARRTRAPVVTVTASGGARMQEGMWSLVQMAKTAEARRAHRAKGLAHVTLLTSPTTGGVYASFASLADVIYAEPAATVGFAGPRVVEQLTGVTPPRDVHTAEFAFEHGLIDAIVARENQRIAIGRALRALTGSHRERVARPADPSNDTSGPSFDAWERLQRVRDPAWPKAADIIDVLLDDAIQLAGDRTGQPDDRHVVVRIGRLAGTGAAVVAVGQNAIDDGRMRPEGLRKAIRAIELAGRLRLPLVTLIDTRGADPLPSSEGTGIAGTIAATFEAMLASPSPTLAVITGEGGSGGALAMAAADRVLAMEGAVFSVISPEGAAAILYRDATKAPELTPRLRITVPDLVELGLVDAVIGEPRGGVVADPRAAIQMLAHAVAEQLEDLTLIAARRRMHQRGRRWRAMGGPAMGGRASTAPRTGR